MLSEATRAKLSEAGKKRAQAFTSEYQKQTRSKLPVEVCKKAGKAGYAALVAAGKQDLARDIAADWRRNHPSNLEAIVSNALRVLIGLRTDKKCVEVKIGNYYVDFKIGKICIEVNDDTWHKNSASFSGNDVEAHDAAKYRYLTDCGYTVVILSEQAVLSGEAVDILTKLFKERF